MSSILPMMVHRPQSSNLTKSPVRNYARPLVSQIGAFWGFQGSYSIPGTSSIQIPRVHLEILAEKPPAYRQRLCCFGQDIGKLVHGGAASDNIIGVDLEPRFLDLGYELFGDRETLRERLYSGDIFDENFLAEFQGKIDIIFVGSFLRLFTFDQQKVIVAQMVRLLRHRENSLAFGRPSGDYGRGRYACC